MAQTGVRGCADFNDWVYNGLGINGTKSVAQIENILNKTQNKLGKNTSYSNYGTGYLACMYLGQLASKKGMSPENITAQNITDGLDGLAGSLSLIAFFII